MVQEAAFWEDSGGPGWGRGQGGGCILEQLPALMVSAILRGGAEGAFSLEGPGQVSLYKQQGRRCGLLVQ